MAQDEMSELVALLRHRVKSAPLPKPQLRLITIEPAKPASRMDSVTRESYVRMIASLRRFYKPVGMDLIVNQALIGRASVDQLDDDELVALLGQIDRARECIADGIGFEDAGLLRDHIELAQAI